MLRNLTQTLRFKGALVILMLMILTPPGAMASPLEEGDVPQSYDCVTYGPCYGGNFWEGTTYGAYSYIYVKTIQCGECITMNRIWDQRLFLYGNGGAIEVGYGVRPYDTYLYWRNMPPNQGEIRYDIEPVPSTYRNQFMRFKLSRNRRGWDQVHVNITSENIAYNWVTIATNSMGGGNNWLASEVDAGGKLTGYNGATSNGYINWQRNAWQTNDGVYHWQTNPGNNLFRHPGTNNPIYPAWLTMPSEATQGGEFYHSCYCD